MSSNSSRIGRRHRRRGQPSNLRRATDVAELQACQRDRNLTIESLPTPLRGSTRVRYQAISAGTTVTVNFMSLIRLISFTTTTTVASTLLEAMKINSIKIWMPPYVQISATSSAVLDAPAPTCVVKMHDSALSLTGPCREHTMVSGPKGGYLCWKPRGACAEWLDCNQLASNTAVFFAFFSDEAMPIVELDFSYQFAVARTPGTAAAIATTFTVDTTSADAIVFMYLDNYANATTEGNQIMKPVQLSSITVNDPSPDPSLWSETRKRIEEAKVPTCSLTTQLPPLAAALVSSSSLPNRQHCRADQSLRRI